VTAAATDIGLRLRLLDFRPVDTGSTLVGFAEVELAPLGLIISDIPVHATATGSSWATPPGKAQLTRDRTLRCDSGGKVLYVPIARWRDRELTRRFSNGVVTLVRRRDPRAFPATADGDAA
jgi:hypothetical protein